jgi:hypothetical protein
MMTWVWTFFFVVQGQTSPLDQGWGPLETAILHGMWQQLLPERKILSLNTTQKAS